MDLTPEQIQSVAKSIEEGMPRMRALKVAGISAGKYRTLIRLAADGEAPYPEFLRIIEKSESEAQKRHITSISTSPDWRAHAFILERQYPQEWGQKIQLEVKRELEKVFAIAQEVLPEEQFIQLLERVSRIDSETVVDADEEAVPLH
jgi:hypothetical protein